MKPEQQRIKLAEWDGWKDIQKCTCSGSEWVGTKDGNTKHIPDYLSDLNAVHELEKKLSPYEFSTYCHLLNGLCLLWLSVGFPVECGWMTTVHATAAQRCEALIKTLGL